jgi:LuxR family maltose regulon positive regulatory protein
LSCLGAHGDGAGVIARATSIAGIVDRPRLTQILDASLVRVCVVEGPSGIGKTTLVRGWATQQGSDRLVIWIPVSNCCSSRHAFWQHLVSSARRHGDLTDDAARSVLEQIGVTSDPARVVITLLEGCGPVTIVLDGYETLRELTHAIDADLARVLATVPDVRLMITTRGHTRLGDRDPQGGVARVIAFNELALTTDEVRELIKTQTDIDDVGLARSIARATRGYALAVRAAVLALAKLGANPRVGSAQWAQILAAKLETLLPDPRAAQFVADTSVPPYCDVELAASLTGDSDPMAQLAVLERNGFGRWIPYARSRPAFQYVETIRDVFHARAAEDPDRFRRNAGSTAAWLFANQDLDQALRFAITAGDYSLAQRIFLDLLVTNPDSYITDRFLTPLQEIPRRALVEHPLLAFALGLALMANPLLRSDAPDAFAISIASPAMPVDVSPDVDAFCSASLRAVALRLVSEFRAAADASLVAVELAERIDPELRSLVGDYIGTVLRQVSYSLLQGGKIDVALVVMARSAALCSTVTLRNYSIAYAAGTRAFAGDIAKARALEQSIDTSAWPDEFKQSYMNGLGLVGEAFARLDAHDFAGALDLVRDSESYIQTAEFWPFVTAVSVAARFGLGQGLAEAERVATELAESPPPPGVGDNVGTEYLCGWLAQVWTTAGDVERAGRILDDQAAESPHLAFARVRLLLAAGEDRRALEVAIGLLDIPGHTLRSRAALQTVAAVAAARAGETELAISWLNGAAVTYETYGPRLHVAMLAPSDRRALRELVRHESRSLEGYLDVADAPSDDSIVPAALTPRELVVLAALAEHGSTSAIAESLVVSRHTVKSQLQSVYRKLGVSSRASAIRVALDLGLLPPGS